MSDRMGDRDEETRERIKAVVIAFLSEHTEFSKADRRLDQVVVPVSRFKKFVNDLILVCRT